jgi:hypothetical protein
MTGDLLREIAREINPKCDRCHVSGGVRFVDHFWMCRRCARVYLQQLETERAMPTAHCQSRTAANAVTEEKRYTVPCTAAQIRNAVVGNVFYDSGKLMRITRVGASFIQDGKPVFSAWAVPNQARDECPSMSK